MPRLVLFFIFLILLLSLAGYIILRVINASQRPTNQGGNDKPDTGSDKIVLFAAIAALLASLLLFFLD